MNKLTPEQLAEIAERTKTELDDDIVSGIISNVENESDMRKYIVKSENALYNLANRLTLPRTDIPALLDHIKALEKENARYSQTFRNPSRTLLGKSADTIDQQAALIAKYEAVLKEYADRENWGRNCESSWIQTVRGWELAEYVMKGDSNQ